MTKFIEAKEKYDYFLISLGFAILAAATQTAKFQSNQKLAMAFELASWATFVIAGIQGIFRLQVYPHHYHLADQLSEMEAQQAAIIETAEKDRALYASAKSLDDPFLNFSAQKSMQELEADLKKFNQTLDKAKELTKKLDNVVPNKHLANLLIAIVLLAFARMLEPIKELFRHLG